MSNKHLLIVASECSPEVEDDYNAWYNDVHLPMFFAFAGLKKASRYNAKVGVKVKTIQADMLTYEIDDEYDVIFSVGTLQYLPPEIRETRFEQFKEATRPGGINAHSAFVKKPFIPRAPDGESTASSYRSGELFGYYWDWEILYCTEDIFDDNSSGVPHKHACNRIIARKLDGSFAEANE